MDSITWSKQKCQEGKKKNVGDRKGVLEKKVTGQSATKVETENQEEVFNWAVEREGG